MAKKNNLTFLCLISILFISIDAFDSIDQLGVFVQTLNEFPTSTGDQWNNPNYENYFKSHKKSSIWNMIILSKQLTKATKVNQKSESSDSLRVIKAQKGARFFLWSDIQGSIHSLYRSLSYLQKKEIIKPDFTLQDEKTYLVFNGNVIGRGAHNLETLSLVLTLLERNPERVYFLCGKQECKGGWRDYGIKKRITIKEPSSYI